MYTLGQAAKATGKSKSTILKSIRNGKVSAEKDENGYWRIDPSELHRVYSSVSQETVVHDAPRTPENTGEHRVELLETELRALRRDNERLESQVEDLRTDRDAWREQAQRKRLTWRGLFGGGHTE